MLSFLFIQCEDDKHIPVSNKNVPGKYIHLEKVDFYLFLPKELKMYSIKEYENYINNFGDYQPFKNMRNSYAMHVRVNAPGYLYFLSSDDTHTDAAFSAIPYIEITKESTGKLLRELKDDHIFLTSLLGILMKPSFNKAGIIKKGDTRMFRAVFTAEGPDELLTNKHVKVYTYYYYINRKGKTYKLCFNTRKEYDFDEYVQKIKF